MVERVLLLRGWGGPHGRPTSGEDAHLPVDGHVLSVAEYVCAIQLFGALVNFLAQFTPPLVPLGRNLACQALSLLLGLLVLLLAAKFADGASGDRATEADRIVELVLATWHRIRRDQLDLLLLITVDVSWSTSVRHQGCIPEEC